MAVIILSSYLFQIALAKVIKVIQSHQCHMLTFEQSPSSKQHSAVL